MPFRPFQASPSKRVGEYSFLKFISAADIFLAVSHLPVAASGVDLSRCIYGICCSVVELSANASNKSPIYRLRMARHRNLGLLFYQGFSPNASTRSIDNLLQDIFTILLRKTRGSVEFVYCRRSRWRRGYERWRMTGV